MELSTNSAGITKQEQDGVIYYFTERRGVRYCAYLSQAVGKWFVSSRRLALGRNNPGSGKYYDDLSQCKPFAALPALLDMGAL